MQSDPGLYVIVSKNIHPVYRKSWSNENYLKVILTL